MSSLVRWLDQKLYPEYRANWDDILFRQEIEQVLKPHHHVLDLGAGAGLVTQMNFRGLAERVYGVDPDPRVRTNSFLDEGHVAQGEAIPYPDSTFDVVFADNLLEHVEDPRALFKEVARSLKPGGLFLVKTPNACHYMPLIARMTPHRFHQFINHRRGRDHADTFPTRYRANSPGKIRYYAAQAGLRVKKLMLIEGRPEYLRLTAVTYLAGWLYERAVNLAPALARFRILLVAVMEKSSEPAPPC
jgi:SAM-dependent methyltransferase